MCQSCLFLEMHVMHLNHSEKEPPLRLREGPLSMDSWVLLRMYAFLLLA